MALITLFSLPKAFSDSHTAMMQENALKSWCHMKPDLEILLLGDDNGVCEMAEEYGCRHLKDIARNAHGTPLLSDIFKKANEAAQTDYVCYVNADIILLPGFVKAVKSAVDAGPEDFLMVGRRHNLNIKSHIDFQNRNWARLLSNRIEKEKIPRDSPTAIDYFVFPTGKIIMPDFAIGRTVWDNWILWDAKQRKARLIDASRGVTAIHHEHDYRHVKGGKATAWTGAEARENLRIAGGYQSLCHIFDSDFVLTDGNVIPVGTWLRVYRKLYMFWHKVKDKLLWKNFSQ